MNSVRLVIRNLEELVQVCSNGELVKRGVHQDEVDILRRRANGVGCAIAVDGFGRISSVGFDDQVLSAVAADEGKDGPDVILDGCGSSLIPGLVDSHTHPVWAGDRCFEFDLKMKGANYLEIHRKGGGIYYSVRETKKATFENLLASYKERLHGMIACGTTLVEAKTGYGLDYETELKMLKVIDGIKRGEDPLLPDTVTTYLGAHAVPEGMSPEEGVDSVLSAMTRLKEEVPEINIDFVDVFCEKGVYNIEQSRKILEAGKAILGASISFHGDELVPLGAGELAKVCGAKAVSHLEFITPTGVQAMAEAGSTAILCPTTAYLLKLPSPPARYLIKKGVPVAIASDFNPNAYCYSLPMAMNLGVVNFGLTLNESLVGTTINAAHALNKAQDYGSLEVGKLADMILLNTSDWRQLIYQFGDTRRLIRSVIKKGTIVK